MLNQFQKSNSEQKHPRYRKLKSATPEGLRIAYYSDDYKFIYFKGKTLQMPNTPRKVIKNLHAATLNKKEYVIERELVEKSKEQNTKNKVKEIFLYQKNTKTKKSLDHCTFVYKHFFKFIDEKVYLQVRLRPLEFSKKESFYKKNRK